MQRPRHSGLSIGFLLSVLANGEEFKHIDSVNVFAGSIKPADYSDHVS
jgi:hypothetical protein